MATTQRPLGERLQSMPRHWLYLLLVLCCSVPLFFDLTVPNTPRDDSIDLYATVMKLKPGSTALIASDWTGSTRGESGGQFESLVRILMRRGVKFAIYSSADPQAPQVAKDSVRRVNEERVAQGEKRYEVWNDWLNLGYLPNAEAAGQAIANRFRDAFPGRVALPPGESKARGAFESPVLKDIRDLKDISLVVIATASKTSTISIERFYGKAPIALMVTGVMGPESLNYYNSGQVVGLVVGLKGLVDVEDMMQHGVNLSSDPKTIVSEKYKGSTIDNFPGKQNLGKGTRYYPTLHFAVALMLLTILIGNIGMFLARKEQRA